MSRVYNYSRQEVEDAERKTCPRCKGHGGVTGDDGDCTLCGGDGEIWQSANGWCRRIRARLTTSTLY